MPNFCRSAGVLPVFCRFYNAILPRATARKNFFLSSSLFFAGMRDRWPAHRCLDRPHFSVPLPSNDGRTQT